MNMIITEPLTPRVWIGSLRMYNEGRLVGDWFDALGAAEVSAADVFRGSGYRPDGDEELWCFDVEDMPVQREMSPSEAAEWGRVVDECDEHLRPALYAWVASGDYTAEGTGDVPVLSDFQDRYCGHWDSFEEYAADLVDSTGMLQGVPEDVARHFDWAGHARELAYDYSVASASERFGHGVFVFRSC